MNTTNLMKDPYYAQILYGIESCIAKADAQAVSTGIEFTDSQIKSALKKVTALAKGKTPKIEDKKEKEKLLSAMIQSIHSTRGEILVGEGSESGSVDLEPVPVKDWLLSLKCVEDSLKLRTRGSGSRDYLEFIADFMNR